MRAVVWIAEGTWEATVDAARSVLPADADVVLLHVAGDAQAVIRGARRGLLGRHPPPPPGPDPVSIATEEEARELLSEAHARLGRDARLVARRGRTEEQVLAEVQDADLLVAARGGEADHLGPRSIGRATRFVLDHARGDVLLVRA